MSDLRLNAYLPYRLSVAANAVSELIARAYQARFGLTIPQWRLIAVLGENGPSTPQVLCALTVMDKVTVSRAAAGLIQRGLVTRSPNTADRRSHHLDLTPIGRGLYDEVAPLALAHERRLLEGFSPDERELIHGLLRRLEVAAKALGGQPRGAI